MTSVKLPLGMRVAILVAVTCMLGAAGFLAYRYWTRPVTFTVAAGSMDGEAVRVISAIASRFAASNAPVRLKVIDSGDVISAAKAFSSGQVDLAVVRGDTGDLSKAAAVAIVTRGVALLMAPPGSSIDGVDGLKGRTVGVLGGEANRKLVAVLTEEYNLSAAKVSFKDLTPNDALKPLQTKQVGALLVTIPLTDAYLALLRTFFPNGKGSPVLVPIEAAGAIAQAHRAYESFDVPKGTLRGSPPLPSDDLTTLRVGYYLVAQKKLSSDEITTLTQSLMSARRDLLSELPIVAQITATSTDPDAYIPAHPGAAAFYNGTEQSFLDKWGNAIFLAPMVLGALASLAAAAWKFLGVGQKTKAGTLDSLYLLARRIRSTDNPSTMSDIEKEIDVILENELTKSAAGDETAIDVGTLNVVVHRLENLIHYRRVELGVSKTPAS